MKILVAIALATAAIALAAFIYRSEPDTLDQRMKAEQAREKEAMHPSPSVVLKISAGNSSTMARAPNALAESPLAQEYNKARNLKSLYDRLSAPGGASTAEAKFYLYRILANCGKVKGMSRFSLGTPGKNRAEQRKELEAMIPLSSPDRDKRLALFDQRSARCEGLETIEATKADVDQLLADAARDGDPKAQAHLAAPTSSSAPGEPMRLNMTDDQYHALQAALASRDPEAIVIAGTALSSSYDDAVFQIGPDHIPLSERASYEAWHLIACEFGMDCGPDNESLQIACIGLGQCAANTVQDQVFYYNVSPHDAQLIDQYRQIFRNAVANNDWSGITLSRQPNTSGSRSYFGIPP